MWMQKLLFYLLIFSSFILLCEAGTEDQYNRCVKVQRRNPSICDRRFERTCKRLKDDEFCARKFGQSANGNEKAGDSGSPAAGATLERVKKASPKKMQTLQDTFNSAANNLAQKALGAFQGSSGGILDLLKPLVGAELLGDEEGVNDVGKYFERDIDLTDIQADELIENTNIFKGLLNGRKRRKVGKEPAFVHWKEFPIPYSFDGKLQTPARQLIREGIRIWEQNTCVRFKENGGGTNRVIFENGAGCSSFIGQTGGVQPISIKVPGCDYVGIITHEIGHMLGFFHEQSRPDQAKYVKIQYLNVQPGQSSNFLPRDANSINDYGVGYDYGSVMHYGSTSFATFRSTYTIVTRDPDYQRTIGQRNAPSFADFKQANLAYCSKECKQKIGCENGGYEDPNDCKKCKCPEGFAGDLCESVQPSTAGCGGVMTVTRDRQIIKSPNHPRDFAEGDECHWIIRAPDNYKVNLQFRPTFDFLCSEPCSRSYVEIKRGPKFESTGYRFCCSTKPNQKFTSIGNSMVVIMKAYRGANKGFSAEVWSDAPPSAQPTTVAPSTVETLAPKDERTTSAPPSTFAPAGDCDCDSWSGWSPCDYDCGGCGYENRQRVCRTRNRDCYEAEKRRCNMAVCEGGSLFRNGKIISEGCCFGLFPNAQGECQGLIDTIGERFGSFFKGG